MPSLNLVQSSSTPQYLVALMGLWLCWGTSFPAIHIMVQKFPPLTASGSVFLIAGAILGTSAPSAIRRTTRKQVTTSVGVGLCLLGAQGAIAVSMQHVYASTAAPIAAAVPLWVVAMRMGRGDYPTPAGLVRLLFGFTGVVIVLLSGSNTEGGWSSWNLLVLAASMLWAAGTLWASRATTTLPGPLPATALQLVSGGAALLAIGALVESPYELSAMALDSSLFAFGYLILIDSLLGFALYNWLLRSAPVALVSTYAYAVPIVACVIGVSVLDEPIHLSVIVGAAIIIIVIVAEMQSASNQNNVAARDKTG